MFKGWTVKEFMVYVFIPVTVIVGGGWVIAWLSPVGIKQYAYIQLPLFGIGFSIVGVVTRNWSHRNHHSDFDLFLDSIPRWAWALFAGGHGVILGLLLGLAWQAPFLPLMLGVGVVAAAGGACLPALRKNRKKKTSPQ